MKKRGMTVAMWKYLSNLHHIFTYNEKFYKRT